jgi:hypothetical protein
MAKTERNFGLLNKFIKHNKKNGKHNLNTKLIIKELEYAQRKLEDVTNANACMINLIKQLKS